MLSLNSYKRVYVTCDRGTIDEPGRYSLSMSHIWIYFSTMISVTRELYRWSKCSSTTPIINVNAYFCCSTRDRGQWATASDEYITGTLNFSYLYVEFVRP